MLVGVVVAVGLVGATLAISDDRGATPAAAPSSTVGTTTIAPSSTTPPPPSRPDLAPTTVPTYSERRWFLPALPTATGSILYGLTLEGRVVRIDLDGGRVSTQVLRRPGGEEPGSGYDLIARRGAAILHRRSGFGLTVPDGEGRVQWIGEDDTRLLAASAPEQLWRLRLGPSGDVSEALLIGLDGVPDATSAVLVPPSVRVRGDDGSGALVLTGVGGAYRLAADGSVTRLTAGQLVAWSPAALVDVVCDDRLACEWRRVDRTTGQVTSLGPVPAGLLERDTAVAMSSDGRRLAVLVATPAYRLDVVDLVTGATATVERLDRPPTSGTALAGWSGDGRHLFWLRGGAVAAWSADPTTPAGPIARLADLPFLAVLVVAP